MNDHTPATDDEALSALLDDALPAGEAEQLRQRLARDAVLQARLDALTRANNAVRRSYADVVDEPLPPRVLEVLAAADGGRSNVVELPARKQRRATFVLPLAAAASVALAIGVALGVLLGPGTPGPDAMGLVAAGGSVAPGTPLDDVLRRAPSATTRALTAEISATPRLTFGTTDGTYCRQVDVTSEQGTAQLLACRRDAGWRLEVVNFAAQAQPGPDGVYRPAAGPSTPIETAVDARIAGEPLDAQAELELIGRNWGNTAAGNLVR